MEELKKRHKLKNGTYGKPERYLGASAGEYHLQHGSLWSLSAEDYLTQACKQVKEMATKEGRRWAKERKSPMAEPCRPENDASGELGEELAPRHMQLIGILRWAAELGRMDFTAEASMLPSCSCAPRAGHLEAACQAFEHAQSHLRPAAAFGSALPELDGGKLASTAGWPQIYGDIKEEIPNDLPETRGNPVQITMLTDAAHAGNLVNRRSHTGIIIFASKAPITWHSKRQATAEASAFGSELAALRVGMEMNEGLRYKLRMMGIPLLGPSNVLCDNHSVVDNASLPESQLKKKHLPIAYHYARE